MMKRMPREESWWTSKICPVQSGPGGLIENVVHCDASKCALWAELRVEEDKGKIGVCTYGAQ